MFYSNCSHPFIFHHQEQIYTGTDITMLLREIKRAQDVINKIAEMRQGMMGDALVSILNEVCEREIKLRRLLQNTGTHARGSLNYAFCVMIHA